MAAPAAGALDSMLLADSATLQAVLAAYSATSEAVDHIWDVLASRQAGTLVVGRMPLPARSSAHTPMPVPSCTIVCDRIASTRGLILSGGLSPSMALLSTTVLVVLVAATRAVALSSGSLRTAVRPLRVSRVVAARAAADEPAARLPEEFLSAEEFAQRSAAQISQKHGTLSLIVQLIL